MQSKAKSKRRRRRVKKTVIQKHHLRYLAVDGYEWTEPIFKNEHFAITWLNRRKVPSQGILTVLRDYIERNESKAVDLSEQQCKTATPAKKPQCEKA
jgi:hypothetical protein